MFAGMIRRKRYEDFAAACAGCHCIVPRSPVGNSCKPSVGSGGARFWRATRVRQGRLKLHPPCRRHAADFARCRTGAFLRIGELRLDLEKVNTVLLTHLHIDHSADLPAFFNARALTSDGPIAYRVFGPDGSGLFPKTSRFIDLLVGPDGAFAYQKTFGARESFTVRDLAITLDSPRTKIMDDDGLIVEEIATHHGDCPSVAYRISYKGVVVVFSGDMDASALPNLIQLAKNADLLIFNCAVLDPPGSPSQLYNLHTPPRKIGQAARDSGVKSLLLSHLAPDVEGQQDAVRKSIRASFAGPVAFATDRLRLPVPHSF